MDGIEEDEERRRILLIYKLALTNDVITKEEKDIVLPIYPNDISEERHQKNISHIIPPTVLIYPHKTEVETLVIRTLYEFCCRFTNRLLFSGVTITDRNPIIEINDSWTVINRKYEIDITETRVILRRNSQIILEQSKWISAETFYEVMFFIYSRITKLQLLPMFTQIKMQGDRVEEMQLIVNKLKDIHHSMYEGIRKGH